MARRSDTRTQESSAPGFSFSPFVQPGATACGAVPPPFSSISLQMPLKICPKVCLSDDSKSTRVDDED